MQRISSSSEEAKKPNDLDARNYGTYISKSACIYIFQSCLRMSVIVEKTFVRVCSRISRFPNLTCNS